MELGLFFLVCLLGMFLKMTIIGYDVTDVFWGVPEGYVGFLITLIFVVFPFVFIKVNEIFVAPRRIGSLIQGG